jgi:hypothetical protein
MRSTLISVIGANWVKPPIKLRAPEQVRVQYPCSVRENRQGFGQEREKHRGARIPNQLRLTQNGLERG